MEAFTGPNQTVADIFACSNCGADLKFKPGTKALQCNYCGTENEIPQLEGADVGEQNFDEMLSKASAATPKLEITAVQCTACGATTTLDPKLKSASCPYCVTPLVVQSGHKEEMIQPGGVLPFKIKDNEAREKFKQWVRKLWFAPSDLKKASHDLERFNGMYIPYWTYDSAARTSYTGQRGTYYYVTENYTTTENGKSVTKTRQVRKTRWMPVNGSVNNTFDDILIIAAQSLPLKYAEKLEPWDLNNVEPFNEAYLGGFITEKYQVDLKTGFDKAKTKMEAFIKETVRKNIGGDEQRILAMHPQYSNITFKHLLLPIYLSAFRYKNKAYRFLINGRTGEVQGERPYSAMKIALLVLAILAVLGVIIFFAVR